MVTPRKIPLNAAEIIVAENNFHGRTTTASVFPAVNVLKMVALLYACFVSVKYTIFLN